MSLIYQAPVTTRKPTTGSSSNSTTTIRPGIYIGDKKDAKNLSQLRQRNIRYIINVTPPKESCYKTGLPNYFENTTTSTNNCNQPQSQQHDTTFQYLRIPIYDSAMSMMELTDRMEQICTFINQAIRYSQTSILIHCYRGISRSVTVAMIYCIRCLDMSYHDAMTMIQRRRPQAQPIPEFISMLQQLERSLSATHDTETTTGNSSQTSGTLMCRRETDNQQGTEVDEMNRNCTAATVNHVSKSLGDDDDVDGDDGETKRSLTEPSAQLEITKTTNVGTTSCNATTENRVGIIVGPQRPPIAAEVVVDSKDGTNEIRTNNNNNNNSSSSNKRQKVIIGPQRPPPSST